MQRKKKTVTKRVGARKDKEWKYRKISVVGGLAGRFSEFSQLVRSSRVEAIIAERREFVLYL